MLFLILIAVALFAALSYAVTQSTRGGGDPADEKGLINSAEMLVYPTSLRTQIQRMVINGVAVQDLEFNPPSDFDNCSSYPVCVFHPDGGNAIYEDGWNITGVVEIDNIGSSDNTGFSGNEIVAAYFDTGNKITESACNKINEKANIPSPPTYALATTTAFIALANPANYMDNDYTPATETNILGQGAGDSYSGKSFGCFDTGSAYILFYTLVEQ